MHSFGGFCHGIEDRHTQYVSAALAGGTASHHLGPEIEHQPRSGLAFPAGDPLDQDPLALVDQNSHGAWNSSNHSQPNAFRGRILKHPTFFCLPGIRMT